MITWQQLVNLPNAELARQDIAAMNLACAADLPGAEQLDAAGCLKTLDRWAERVKFETDRHSYRFRRSPQDFENSWGRFRAIFMATVLQQDCDVGYNLSKISAPEKEFFSDAANLFVIVHTPLPIF
jgi:hypothetical protein